MTQTINNNSNLAGRVVTAMVALTLTISLLAGSGFAQNGGWGTTAPQATPTTPSNSQLGQRLAFRNGELYFTGRVTQRQAEKVLEFLDDMYGEQPNFKSYQLDKDGNELVLKSVVGESALNSNELDYAFEAVEFLLQTVVFTDDPVRLELTDTNFNTRKVFNKLGVRPFGQRIAFNKNELFYTRDVTRDEADKLTKFLMDSGGADTEVSFQIDREGDTIVIRMVGNEDAQNTDKHDATFDAMEREFQSMVFTEDNVRFEITNYQFEAAKMFDKIPANG